MPPKRKTLEELARSGSLQKNRGRYASRMCAGTSPDDKVRTPPRHLSVDEKKVWRELVAIAPPGVLANSDLPTIEVATRLMARLRNAPFIMKISEQSLLLNTLAKLGMTPTDRARFDIPPNEPEKEDDPWAQFDSN